MNISIPDSARFILDKLISNNYKAYIVGGCVRDSLLKKKPKDWDITTSALPEQIINLFDKTIHTGIKHGTVTVVINGENFEVTTFRVEGSYSDNRHPDEVFFTSQIKEDLSRRDFTINAMAYNPLESLVDVYGGKEDLNNKLIRCVGDADERFKEDALRMLRAIRFSSQLGFALHTDTFDSIIKNSFLIKNVSNERIRDELIKILLSSKPSTGIRLLHKAQLLKYILPELNACVGFEQHNPHHYLDVFDHTMEVLDLTSEDLTVRLSALLHDIAKPQCFAIDENGTGHFYMHEFKGSKISETIMKRLRFDNNTLQKVTTLIKEHLIGSSPLKKPALKKLINRVGIENLDNLFNLKIADIKAHKPPHNFIPIYNLQKEISKIIDEKQPLTVKDLKINGSDLIKLGIPADKSLGNILNMLLDAVLENPELNNSDELLKLAVKFYTQKNKD